MVSKSSWLFSMKVQVFSGNHRLLTTHSTLSTISGQVAFELWSLICVLPTNAISRKNTITIIISISFHYYLLQPVVSTWTRIQEQAVNNKPENDWGFLFSPASSMAWAICSLIRLNMQFTALLQGTEEKKAYITSFWSVITCPIHPSTPILLTM